MHYIDQKGYRHLLSSSQYPSGISIDDQDDKNFDDVVNAVSLHVDSLLSTEKVVSEDIKQYNGYVRIFAGEGSPEVDGTFSTHHVPNSSVCVHCKLCPAREYSSYLALSISFFQRMFHGIMIIPLFIELIQHAVGNRGLFLNRNRSSHHGSLSYIGPRQDTTQSQPSPSEGPHEGDSSYCYHHTFINHAFWPFMLHLMNRLDAYTEPAKYYFYKHLNYLYPR